MTREPVVVHVLTGFLGSGKSTILNQLLRTPALARSAVVVNEFGPIGIDHYLVRASEDDLITLSGGCVCCEVRGDLARTLADLLDRRDAGRCVPFERIVIETTGLADPVPILNLLATDPVLAHATTTGRVITTVDAVNGMCTLDRFPESRRQIALADHVLLTKSDLAPAGRVPLEQRVAALNPRAPLRAIIDGKIDAAHALFSDGGGVQARSVEMAAHAQAHGEDIMSFSVCRDCPVPAAALTLFIEVLAQQLGDKLLRLKGLVCLAESPELPAVVHGAQHVFHPVELLEAWPDSCDRATRLVFITQADVEEWVERVLDAVVWEVEETSRRLHGVSSIGSSETQEGSSCSI